MGEHDFQWKRMRFKRNKVWLAVDANGQPIQQDSRVLIKYQLDQEHQYWVHPGSVRPLDENEKETEHAPAASEPTIAPALTNDTTDDHGVIRIYTDGACSGNPGPAGIGIVMHYQNHAKEISRYIGVATNNIAELEAIRTALVAVKNPALPVVIYTDSSYALGILSKGWKARENVQLVAEIRGLMEKFKALRMVKVKGHAGHPENERADLLAVAAITAANDGVNHR